MNRPVFSALLLTLALAACTSSPPASAPLAGHWSPAQAMLAGQEFPVAKFDGGTLRLTADAYDFAGDKGSYEILPAGPPAQMDIHGHEGPNAGRTIHAIYVLTGDKLTICYQLGTGERPGEFASPKGSQVLLVHYTRIP